MKLWRDAPLGRPPPVRRGLRPLRPPWITLRPAGLSGVSYRPSVGAFSEAACLMIRSCAPVKAWLQRREKNGGKRKALALLEAKLGRTVYHLWRKQVPFDAKRFLRS